MRKSFNWRPGQLDFLRRRSGSGAVARWLPVAAGVLLLLNAIALFLYVFPPGGSRADLLAQSQSVRSQIASARRTKTHLQAISGKVQIGSRQAAEFGTQYFLKRRDAYEQILSELQRMANASGLQARDGVNSEEPIEGTADLTLLNLNANYEGTYEQLTHFLHEADRSPMLLMLGAVQAAPQQRNGQLTVAIQFQTVVRDEVPGSLGGQP